MFRVFVFGKIVLPGVSFPCLSGFKEMFLEFYFYTKGGAPGGGRVSRLRGTRFPKEFFFCAGTDSGETDIRRKTFCGRQFFGGNVSEEKCSETVLWSIVSANEAFPRKPVSGFSKGAVSRG